MKVTPEGFAHMTHMLSVLANGKLVLALEGGYNVDSIAKSAYACVEVLVGDEPKGLQLVSASMSATNAVQEVIRVQARYWKSMGCAVEPADGELARTRSGSAFAESSRFIHTELKSAGKVVPIAGALCLTCPTPTTTLTSAFSPLRPSSQRCSRPTASTSSTTSTSSLTSRSVTSTSSWHTTISCCARESCSAIAPAQS